MKKILTRILCGLICAATIFGNTAVFAAETTANVQEAQTQTETENKEAEKTETEEKTGLRYNPNSRYPVYSGYVPDYSIYESYQYDLFMDLLRLYTDTHLFEFTEAQAAEAFLMKLMQENPDLMKLFMDTLLTTMDPYSGYYEAGTGLASDGSSTGYGVRFADETNGSIITMGLKTPGLYISDVVKGSPAEKAGILVGDRIVSVEGISLDGVTLEGASYLLKSLPYVEKEQFDEQGNSLGIPNEPEFIITDEKTGRKAYPIHLEIERKGTIIPIKMVKERVIYSDIIYERAADRSYSYIQIASFSSNTVKDDFRAALEKAKKESNGNLLIDLRDNAGGSLEAAIAMADMLIPEKGRVMCYFNSRGVEKPEAIYSTEVGYKFDKITILVNEYTASAAELFAMTLSYNSGATLVGTTTYGKAVGQQAYNFVGGDMFTITAMEILDPLKRSYHNIGITPDVEVDIFMKKYNFPKDVNEFLFLPNSTIEDKSPTAVEGAQLPCVTFTIGEESENHLAMEMRLEILGFLRPEYVDGKVDEATIAAIKSYETYAHSEPHGILDESEVKIINSMSEKYKNRYYTYDSQFEVAIMTFSSRSQAKRRAKELLTAHNKVQKDYEAYIKAEEERIKQEELEERKKAEAEKQEAAS